MGLIKSLSYFILVTFLFSINANSQNSALQSERNAQQEKYLLQVCAENKYKKIGLSENTPPEVKNSYIVQLIEICKKEKNSSPPRNNVTGNGNPNNVSTGSNNGVKSGVTAPNNKSSNNQNSLPNSSSPATSTAVIGGCGSPEQCAAYMAEANAVKYTWSSPGLQVYLGELWGNNFNYAYSLGGTFEQPENACNEGNQGQVIGFDMGTEIRPIACMSNKATQEELKAMAEKLKTIDVTTIPTVVAVKKPQYQWKLIKEADPIPEGGMRICNGVGECSSSRIGEQANGGGGMRPIQMYPN